MPVYEKLVRDRIPAIIEAAGKECRVSTLDEATYSIELKKKLLEEVKEYENAVKDEEALEELADILEVMRALATLHGSDMEQLEEIRNKKAEQRGGFQERIFLHEVKD